MLRSRIRGFRPLVPALLGLGGCWGRDIPYEGGDSSAQDSTPVASVCGEDVDGSAGLVVTGPTRDAQTGGTVAPGLCVYAVDPTPALTGGSPTVLATATVCDDGSYVVGPIADVPTIGMFVEVDDCEGADDTVMLTATGISPKQLDGLGAGDTLMIEALSASTSWVATEGTDLARLGWSGDLATDGYMAGIVEDAQAAPVGGATVSAGGTDEIYYEDADASDGIYGADTTRNTSTSADAGGMFMIPAAPIFSYSCDDGGAHSWDATLLGSLPGYAVYIRFTAL